MRAAISTSAWLAAHVDQSASLKNCGRRAEVPRSRDQAISRLSQEKGVPELELL